jgi:hypothetical protein
MAKLFAEVTIAGNYKRLAQATKGANAQMKGMAKQSQSMSKLMKASFAGIGIQQLASQLISMAKAADADNRSMALLNTTLDRTWKATDETKKSVDEFLRSMEMASGVAGEDLRIAYATIARSTKSVTKANRLFTLAMDISAGTGKDLNAVTLATSKYLAGNKKAFDRLIPGASKSADVIGELEKKFGGLAEKNASPFALINVQVDEFKEAIGREILPYIQKLAKWMNSKEGQKTIKETTAALVELVKEAAKLAKFALDNKEVILGIAIALKGWQIGSAVFKSWKTLADLWKGMKVPKVPTGGVGLPQGPTAPGGNAPTGDVYWGKDKNKGKTQPKVKGKIPGGVKVGALGAAAAAVTLVLSIPSSSTGDTPERKKERDDLKERNDANREWRRQNRSWNGVAAVGAAPTAPSTQQLPFMQPGNITINVNAPNVSGPAVLDALKKTARRKGVPLKLLID